MQEKKVAIYGAGSLGTVLGAFMTQNGVDVELVNRNKAHVEALRENGARITGTVEMTVPVKAIFPDEMAGTYEVIFLMTKQLFNDEVVTFLKPMLTEDGVIVTLQNGIPEPGIAAIVGKAHTIGCTVEWGATLSAPGECILTSDKESLSFHMGRMQGITDAQMDRVLVGGVFGDVSEDKAVQPIALRCMKECIDVGHAAGETFAPVQGKDITKLFYYTNGLKKAFAKLLLPIAMKKHRDIEPSMLQDLKKGKPCEVDAINGVVCEWGRKCGVPTPVNDRIVEVIKKEQAGELPLDKSNIRLFDDLK